MCPYCTSANLQYTDQKQDNILVGCVHLPTIRVLVAVTRCKYQSGYTMGPVLGGGRLSPQVNKFKQVSSTDH